MSSAGDGMDRRTPAGSRLVGSGSHELAGYTTIMVTPTLIPSVEALAEPTKITRIEVDERADASRELAYGLAVVRRWSRRWRLALGDRTTDLLHLQHVGRRVSVPATDFT